MKKALKKCLALIFTFTFIFLIWAVPASAANYTKTEFRLSSVKDKNLYSYTSKEIYVGTTKLSEQALLINSVVYVPIRSFTDAVTSGATVTYDAKSRTITVAARGLTLTATDGAYTVYANGRPLFMTTPVTILSNGRMYVPLKSLAKAYGLSYSEGTYSINVRGSYSALTPASQFYRDDEVLWLSRIISAESRGESLIGQIAVGNVVLNRVRSSSFPNTIYGVIFDRKYGTQFSPVSYGTIYNEPSESAVIAAKICLEGYTMSDKILFFMNPRIATTNWIAKNRPYAFTIGNHSFYE